MISTALDSLKSSVATPLRRLSERMHGKYRDVFPPHPVPESSEQATDEQGKPVKIRVSNLYKVYGRNPSYALRLLREGADKETVQERTSNNVGLNDVSFDVMEGELFVLMGLSGSGKSTLERCMIRLVEPTAGTVEIDGVDVTALGEDDLRAFRRKKMSMVFQGFGLLPHRNIIDNVSYGLEIQGIPREERYAAAKKYIDMVGLAGYEENFPDDLSGGMKQRVGLARALTTDPDILFMDEAFSALDPLIRGDMQDELEKIHSELGKTIVFVTHDLDEALRLGDRIALMRDGKIIKLGAPEEILMESTDEYVTRFVKEVDRTKVLTAGMLMRRPRGVINSTRGPRNAMRMMEETGRSTLFVVANDNKLLGMVESDDVMAVILEGGTLMDAMEEDVPTVMEDTPINDVIHKMVTTNFPIPVLDADGKLIGTVSPSAAAKMMSNGDDAQ